MSSSKSRLAELANAVAVNTQRIDSYLCEKALPHSFAADSPVDLSLPPELKQSRLTVLEASQELNDLLRGPKDLLFNHHHNQLVPLKLISQFDLANEIPANGEIPFGDLVAKIGVDCAALTRILRLGIAHRVFNEPRPGVITHSAVSKLIADDSSVADWLGANVDDMWPSAEKTVEALVKWPLATEPNQTGFSLANGTADSFYIELEKNPERARRFGGAMSFLTTGEGQAFHHVINGYAWSALGAATVVNVGGSHGDAAFAFARKFPHFQLVVQELPQVVASCKEQPGLNVRIMSHDLFEEQPVRDAHVYLYRWICHNWPDSYCIRMLRALAPAQGGRDSAHHGLYPAAPWAAAPDGRRVEVGVP
ncbi:O-methyltransferase, family 2, partial [Metarhizium hybridum]